VYFFKKEANAYDIAINNFVFTGARVSILKATLHVRVIK
jgi:hypothetical protein